jgi:hypothetical protein
MDTLKCQQTTLNWLSRHRRRAQGINVLMMHIATAAATQARSRCWQKGHSDQTVLATIQVLLTPHVFFNNEPAPSVFCTPKYLTILFNALNPPMPTTDFQRVSFWKIKQVPRKLSNFLRRHVRQVNISTRARLPAISRRSAAAAGKHNFWLVDRSLRELVCVLRSARGHLGLHSPAGLDAAAGTALFASSCAGSSTLSPTTAAAVI